VVPVNRSTTAYDAVGCLACGLLILAACEAGYDGRWLIERNWSPAAIGLCGVVAVCLGRIVSAASRLLIDEWFVGGCLPRPWLTLLSAKSCLRRGWKPIVFSGYFRPLPEGARELVERATKRETSGERASSIDPRAFAKYSASERERNRLLQFCSFYRTMCVGLLVVAAVLVSGIICHCLFSSWGQAESRKLGYAFLALLESVGMLYRYLKYLRQHAAAILLGIAELRTGAATAQLQGIPHPGRGASH
jgi:hypothetical protein